MAQAQVEETGKKGLKREFTVKVPRQEIEKNLVAKLEQLGRTARMPGFRPGKIPMPVLKQRFGPGVRAEILDKMVSKASQKALADRKLRPAAEPQIELVAFGEDQDLEFKMAVEILPEITPGDFTQIALERPTAEVTDKIVDEAIAKIAKSMREPEPIAEKRAAKKGDIAVIDFAGKVDGKSSPGMQGKDHRLELGSKSFIDNFEEQIVGLKPGDKKTVNVTFPADYHAAELAGKKAEFEVEVKELRAAKPVEINDAFAKELGLQTAAELRQRVRDDIAASYQKIGRAVIKRHLLDKLAAAHDFEVPAGLVDGEFSTIWQQVEESKKQGKLPADEAKKSDEQLRKEYRAIAERRIRLGLLLSEVAQKNNIGVSPAELQSAMAAEAGRYPGQEKAVIEFYTRTPGALERLRAPLIEEKVIDHIIAQAKVTDRQVSAAELLKMPEEME